MKKAYVLIGLFISSHCFVTYNQDFEKEYLRILDGSIETLLKEHEFNESYKGQELRKVKS